MSGIEVPDLRKIETFQSVPDEERLRLFAEEDAARVPDPGAGDVVGRMGTYIQDHPTSFDWHRHVHGLVHAIEREWPWLTYVCTYFWHPPYAYPSITRRYDPLSLDVWGGGLSGGEYKGYRGKPLPDRLHEAIFDYVFYGQPRPIHWVCTNGWLWVRGRGWSRYDPPDPQGADLGHRWHLHLTMQPAA